MTFFERLKDTANGSAALAAAQLKLDAAILIAEAAEQSEQSKAALAKVVGVSRARFAKVTSGEIQNFTLDVLGRAAGAMGLCWQIGLVDQASGDAVMSMKDSALVDERDVQDTGLADSTSILSTSVLSSFSDLSGSGEVDRLSMGSAISGLLLEHKEMFEDHWESTSERYLFAGPHFAPYRDVLSDMKDRSSSSERAGDSSSPPPHGLGPRNRLSDFVQCDDVELGLGFQPIS